MQVEIRFDACNFIFMILINFDRNDSIREEKEKKRKNEIFFDFIR